jgi:hypothetical protein
LCDEQPVQAISSQDTTVSRQPILCHNPATLRSSSSVCALYRGHSRQLSPQRVMIPFMDVLLKIGLVP